ncbi:PspC domain-containing protein [Candidatus Parcubacteria bacterium]|nr:MAG: PspC domain-containing protein [Candidatus Parcubacteria bacterium]
MKKLYRSRENRVLAGIIGGLGEYFNVDPVILRLAWLLIVVSTGVLPGVIAYLIGILVVPKAS